MLYTSSKKALIQKLQGIGKEMQCNDDDDLAWSSIVEKCQSKYDWDIADSLLTILGNINHEFRYFFKSSGT